MADLIVNLTSGKIKFYNLLEIYKVPVETAVGLWDVAYLAGQLVGQQQAMDSFKKHVSKGLILLILLLPLQGCSKVTAAGNPRAERVGTTEAGYVCFIIRDENGVGVGGNCVAD